MIETIAHIAIVAANIISWMVLLVLAVFIGNRISRKGTKTGWFKRFILKLRKKHITLSKWLIVLGLIHGIGALVALPHFTDYQGSDFLAGIICMVLLILLGLSVQIKRIKPSWIFWHRALAIAFLVTITWHLAVEIPMVEREGHSFVMKVEEKSLAYTETR